MGESCCRDILRKLVYKLFDLFVILFIITPACVFTWRGTWILMDSYLLSSTPKYSYWISYTAGIAYCICCHFFQDVLNRIRMKLRKYQIVNVFLTRLYYYAAAIFGINVWRGAWGLLDIYLGKGIEKAVISSLVGFAVLIPLRGITNLSFPPSFLSFDWQENQFDLFHTRFERKEGDASFVDDLKHIGDVLFSYLLLILADITIWRSLWECIDALLDPNDPVMTGFVSASYGYLMFLFLFVLNPFVQRAAAKLSRFWLLRLLFLQFYAFIKFTAINSMWRGVWYILDTHVFPHNEHYRGIVAHVVGVSVLIIMGTMRSVGEVVFSIDGVDEFEPVSYLSHLRKICSNGQYSLVSTKDRHDQEASQIAQDSEVDDNNAINNNEVNA